MSQDPDFTPPRASFFFIAIIATTLAFMLSLGTMFSISAMEYAQVLYAAPTYAQTQGKITRSTVKTQGKNTLPDIHFSYTVDGKSYKADNRHTAVSYRDHKLASRAAQTWRVHSSVPVFYDKSAPERATLSRHIPKTNTLMRTAFGLSSYAVAIFTLIGAWRTRKRVRARAYSRFLNEKRHPKNK